ncbi:hypothetical protein D6745_03935 [Candidatus Woesearchaeota archaeon]|nr:MAG: hypothetical protein D6745_03935 [Candidatus Woesearchaeota archaeon]
MNKNNKDNKKTYFAAAGLIVILLAIIYSSSLINHEINLHDNTPGSPKQEVPEKRVKEPANSDKPCPSNVIVSYELDHKMTKTRADDEIFVFVANNEDYDYEFEVFVDDYDEGKLFVSSKSKGKLKSDLMTEWWSEEDQQGAGDEDDELPSETSVFQRNFIIGVFTENCTLQKELSNNQKLFNDSFERLIGGKKGSGAAGVASLDKKAEIVWED